MLFCTMTPAHKQGTASNDPSWSQNVKEELEDDDERAQRRAEDDDEREHWAHED